MQLHTASAYVSLGVCLSAHVGLHRSAPPRLSVWLQELLALPSITPEVLQKFQQEVGVTHSEKEQRNIIRKLLLQSGKQQYYLSTAACRDMFVQCK